MVLKPKNLRNLLQQLQETSTIYNIPLTQYIFYTCTSSLSAQALLYNKHISLKWPPHKYPRKSTSLFYHSPQFSSVAHLCLTLYDHMDCSMHRHPVHHQFLEQNPGVIRNLSSLQTSLVYEQVLQYLPAKHPNPFPSLTSLQPSPQLTATCFPDD